MATFPDLRRWMLYALLAIWLRAAEAALRKEELTFTWEEGAPNGQARNMIFTNGAFPGPNLVFEEGDQVEVTVHNRMLENTTVHWHGLLMRDTPWADGVPGLSQKPIEPGESFVYRFTAYPPGQYWYHSHSRATLLDGLYGAILIRRKPGTPNPFHLISEDAEDIAAMEKAARDPITMLISDWSYYNSTDYSHTFEKSQLQIFCVDSILVNGKGSVFCPDVTWINDMELPFHEKSWPNSSLTDKGCFPFVPSTEGPWLKDGDPSQIPYGMQEGCVKSWGSEEIIEVDAADKWISVNWIGAATFKTIQPTIDEHEMWIYEVDGHYIEPRKTTTMLLWAGERYSAMVKLDKKPKDYSIRVIDGGYSQMIGAFARMRYKDSDPQLVDPDPWFNVSTTSQPFFGYNAWPWVLTTMLDDTDLPPWPPQVRARHSDAMHVLELGKANSTWEFTLSGRKKYPQDRSAYHPLLYTGPDAPEAHDEDLIIRTKNGTWVDLVLQVGQSPMWPVDFPHPVHKHANKFWRIGSGAGIWNYSSVDEAIEAEPQSFNLETPPYRDTFLTDFFGAMWVVLRYQVTTPGAWLLHCHIELHLDNGMAMAILDGVDAWPEVPHEYSSGAMGFKTLDAGDEMEVLEPTPCVESLAQKLLRLIQQPFWQALGLSSLASMMALAGSLAWRWTRMRVQGTQQYQAVETKEVVDVKEASMHAPYAYAFPHIGQKTDRLDG